jgi:hypothetical protein
MFADSDRKEASNGRQNIPQIGLTLGRASSQ